MTYCPLPFRHVFLEPRGVKPCCSYTQVADMTIDQWLGSTELAQLQKNILNGQIDPGCVQCINNEKAQGVGTRLGALKDYGDQRFETTAIDYIDYRSSNICNFKCRTCEPFFSNGIAFDVRRSPVLQSLYAVPPNKTATVSDSEWVLQNLPQLRRIMFTGGEPTMLPEVRAIIDRVRQQDRDINIQIITNGSFQDPYWLDIAASMPNVNFTVSIDAVGQAAETIRHGTDWALVERNIRELAQHSHSLNFSTVISRYNVFQLIPLLKFVRDIRLNYDRLNGRTQFIQLCNHPAYLNPINWPEDYQHQAQQYLLEAVKIDNHAPTVAVLENLQQLIKTHVYDPDLWQLGESYNEEVNRLRNQTHVDLYQPSF